jgi:hypothetical protein
LGIRESNPNFTDFSGTENLLDKVDSGSQEKEISQVFFKALPGSHPHPVSFYIHTNKIPGRKFTGQIE